jgi:hypothetical protein
MSNDVNDVSLDDVADQLHAYGRWLETRSDVELGAADTDLVDDLGQEGAGGSRRPRFLAGVAAVAALITVVAVGIGLDGRGDDGDQLEAGPADLGGVTADNGGADTPTSDTEDPARPAVGTDADPTGVDGVPVGSEPVDGAEGSSSGDETGADVDGGGSTAGQTVADDAAAGEDESTPDMVITPSTVVLDENGNVPQTAAPAAGAVPFTSPTNGATLDLNAMNTLRARPTAGASTYVFEGFQNGASVMSVSVTDPSLLLPSRLISSGMTSQMSAGSLRLTVTALDAAGNAVGSGQVDVTVASAGRDAMGDNPFPTNP